MRAIEMLRRTRKRIVGVVEGIGEEELLWIPPGFRNNILWNLGHIAVTQQMLHYGPAGLPLHLPPDVVTLFRNGSSPADWKEAPTLDSTLRMLTETPELLEADHAAGRFSSYAGYTTRGGMVMEGIEEALAFNQFHEGIHTGIVQTMRRMWTTRHT